MLDYPLNLSFKVLTAIDHIEVTDRAGRQVAHAREGFEEDLTVYGDDTEQKISYRIQTEKVVDFNATYEIITPDGRHVGAVRQKSVKSFWRSTYDLLNAAGREVGAVRERNPRTALANRLVTMPFHFLPVPFHFLPVPFLDEVGYALDGFFFRPSYLVGLNGRETLCVRKRRSLLKSGFTVEKLGHFSEDEEDLLFASILIIALLENDLG